MIDQRLLPTQEIYNTYTTVEGVAEAIRSMVIRGAPAIGVATAMGLALGVKNLTSEEDLESEWQKICETIRVTRPTARNLFWAIERMDRVFRAHCSSLAEVQDALEREAREMHREDIEINQRIGRHGQELISQGSTVLTHCNAGALATAGYGTALGVVRAAVEAGKGIQVFADETRPFLQGARLTSWEMVRENIPCTLITDNMAGYFMQSGRIQAVVVGRRPDRRQRRYRQQDRHLRRRRAGQGARDSLLRGGSPLHHRPGDAHRRPDSHRAARHFRDHPDGGTGLGSRDRTGGKPRLRRDPQPPGRRHHHRGGCRTVALRGVVGRPLPDRQ